MKGYRRKRGQSRRKICFVITSFIHYSRSFLILEELRKRSDVELHIVIGGAALLSKYTARHAYVKDILERDGYTNLYEMYFNLEGDTPVTKAKTTGLGVIEFSTLFNTIKPDLIVVRGDRFEVLAASIAGAYMNIPIAHIEGGDLSGTLDESVRHAITKLAHIHFVTNEPAQKRIVRMGENEHYVYNFGSPEIEVVHSIAKGKHTVSLQETGSGAEIALQKDFLMVMFHPVHGEGDAVREHTKMLLSAVHETGMPVLWFWPNFDAGSEAIAHELRRFKEEVKDHKIHFTRYLPPRDFITLLRDSRCLIGNSSAGIKETSYLGVPVVNVGSRQNQRLRAPNVMDVPYDTHAIKRAIDVQLQKGRYEVSDIYFKKGTGKNIAKVLATVPLYTQKTFID